MKKLRLFLIITIGVLVCTRLIAQTKIVSTSEKLRPSWILQPGPDFIVASGYGYSLEESQLRAFDSTKKAIELYSINSMLTTNQYLKSKNIDYRTAEELFKNTVFYQDVSLTSKESFYWEKLKNKESKTVIYQYFLKYPLNKDLLRKTIQEVSDNYKLSVSYDSLNMIINRIEAVEDLNFLWHTATQLSQKFAVSDIRKAHCDSILILVEEAFKSIEIKEIINIPGKIIVVQLMNNNTIETTTAPSVTSNCATITRIDNYKETWTIQYSYEKCLVSDDNYIHIEFENGYGNPNEKFNINVESDVLEIKVTTSAIVINKQKIAKIYIASMHRGDLIIDNIVLYFNDLHYADTRIGETLDGAGVYDISFSLPPDINKIKINDRIKGEVHYRSVKTGQKGVYKFYNQKVIFN